MGGVGGRGDVCVIWASGAGGGGLEVSEFFLTQNPIFCFFARGEGGGGYFSIN